MSITLDALTLPDDLVWSDEYAWTPVKQDISVSLTGVVFVEEAVQQGGRPITLSAADDAAWMARSLLDALLCQVPDHRHHDPDAA